MQRTSRISKLSKRQFKMSSFLWLLAFACLYPLKFAHAYLDGGTGSYIIQVAIGVFFGGIYMVRSFGSKIIQRIKDKRVEKKAD